MEAYLLTNNEEFTNIKFGDNKIFLLLYNAMNENLEQVYSLLLDSLLVSNFWSVNDINAPRVLCKDGRICRENNEDIFLQLGLYLWGAGNIPLYIGKTKDCFKNRFNRFIWDEKSQCNLAKELELEMKCNGYNEIPKELLTQYKNKLKVSNIRLQDAAAFAKHGVNNVWFTLFPTENINGIDELEEKLIQTGNIWNIKNGFDQLINIHHK